MFQVFEKNRETYYEVHVHGMRGRHQQNKRDKQSEVMIIIACHDAIRP